MATKKSRKKAEDEKTTKSTEKKTTGTKSAKKTSKPVEEKAVLSEENKGTETTENTTGTRKFRVHKSTIIIAVVIILLGALVYFGRSWIVAAVVNGQPISRLALIQEAEKASGSQAMALLIRNVLVEQEAREQNVTVSEEEINNQIKEIESNLSQQGQKLEQVLEMEGLSREDLTGIVRLDLLVTKMVEKGVNVTDEQVNQYIEENRDFLPAEATEEDLMTEARERLRNQQVAQKAQEWLANLEKDATIVKFVNY